EEGLANDHKTPLVADDLERARYRAWASPHEAAVVGGAPCIASGLCRPSPGTGSVAKLNIARFEFGQALRTGDDRMAFSATNAVDQHQRRAFAVRKPAVAELHQRNEARVEIKTHFGKPVFFALPGFGRDLPENLQPCQLSQTVGQRCARNVERRTKRFERARAEKGFANDQERPGVRNN